MPTPSVQLHVNGEIFDWFVSGSVSCSMERPASSFNLEYSAQIVSGEVQGSSRVSGVIDAGDPCSLRTTLDTGETETLVTGFLDAPSTTYDAERVTFRVSGRSRTCDLVDGSCLHKPRNWRNKHIGDITNDASEGYASGVTVIGDPGERFDKFKYEAGDGAIEVIRRAAKLRGFYLFDTPEGDLLLDRVGQEDTQTTLRRGENIVAGERSEDWSQRHSSYHFCGSTHATDELTGKTGRQLLGEVNDPAIQATRRFRPLVITATGQGGREDLGKRAIVERNTRAGRSERVRITVDGWADARGLLWRPGSLVTVDDDWLRISNSRFVIVGVTYRFGPEGEAGAYQTKLELTRPEAFDLGDYPARGRGDLWTS